MWCMWCDVLSCVYIYVCVWIDGWRSPGEGKEGDCVCAYVCVLA